MLGFEQSAKQQKSEARGGHYDLEEDLTADEDLELEEDRSNSRGYM